MNLIRPHLCISAYGFATLGASVGAELVEAAHAHRLVIFLDVLFALQVVSAVEAVKTLSHCGAQIAAGACRDKTKYKNDCQCQTGILNNEVRLKCSNLASMVPGARLKDSNPDNNFWFLHKVSFWLTRNVFLLI